MLIKNYISKKNVILALHHQTVLLIKITMEARLFTILLLLLSSVGLKSQTIVNYPDNSLLICDTNTYQEIKFVDPGNAGAGQIWDFSKMQLTGKDQPSTLQAASLPKLNGVADYNISLLENGYNFCMNLSEKGLEELGYVNTEQKLVMRYSDPVLKMKYPFSFGDHFTDHFVGQALYDGISPIEFFGDHEVTADANGTLILPDRVLEGTLRVKSIKKGLQLNTCGTTDITILKYSWYAPGFRYPVLTINTIETSANGGAPVVTKSASTNTQQISPKSAIIDPGLLAQSKPVQLGNEEVKVVIAPNPFTENLTYDYLLSEPLTVTIELYDMSGKFIGSIANNQPQVEGVYKGQLSASTYGLIPGAYLLRFVFSKQVSIFKVVKM